MTSDNLRTWCDNWMGVKEIILFGNGKTCQYHLRELCREFHIKCIVDNDRSKQGTFAEGHIPVKAVDEITSEIGRTKIVVFSAYEEVSRQLMNLGAVEYVDFCDYRVFVTAWNWFVRKQIHISEVHMAVTTKCTLNCRNCNMFIPRHREEHTSCHVELERLKKDADLLFSKVDRVYRISLVGGETFLYPNLRELIDYVSSKYGDRYQQIEIYTNGMVPLDDEMCTFLKKKDIVITLSNYRNVEGAYEAKVDAFREMLKKHSICFKENVSTEWFDFQFPDGSFHLSDEKAKESMLLCNPGFRGFNDGKFYFCHIVWSAVLCKSLEDNSSDYIDFHDEVKGEEIVNYQLGIMDDRFVSLCKYCAGCSSLYRKIIPAALQVSTESEDGITEA